MKSKQVTTLKEAIQLAGLKDGMTVSFHHHLRNGDFVLNMVMEAIALAKQQGKGAISLHGKMIDAPIVARAEQTIAMARELGMGRED